jgi:drug/metabolite transporter (DMT)-like permease
MIQIFIAFALIASGITTNKFLLAYIPPIFLVGIRMLSAGIILSFITQAKKTRVTCQQIAHDALPLILIIICTTYLPAVCKSYALKYMTSSQVAFFGTLDPFITALYTYFLWNEKLTLRKITGISIAMIGTLILLKHADQATTTIIWYLSFPEIAALLAVVIGRYGWILVQSLLRTHRYTPMQLNSITMIGSGILSLITSVGIEHITIRPIDHMLLFLALIAYTVIIGNVISLTWYAELLKHYPATLLSLAGFSVPLFVYFYGWFFLREPLSPYFFISFLCSLIGFILFAYPDIYNALRSAIKHRQKQ